MALEIIKTFTVNAPPDQVWAFLIDVHRVARCLPGAAITGQLDEKTYAGTMTVKVGPVSSSYKGKVIFERLDPAGRSAEIVATGQDVKGKGGADLRLTSTLEEVAPGQTKVIAASKVNITGILAQMGRGMIQDVSDQIFQVFSQRMRTELESGAAAAAIPPAAPAVSAPLASAPLASAHLASAPAAAAPMAAASRPAPLPAPSSPAPLPAPGSPSPLPPAIPAPSSAPSSSAAPVPLQLASAGTRPEALDLGALGARSAGRAALRALGRPGVWLAIFALAVLIYLLKR